MDEQQGRPTDTTVAQEDATPTEVDTALQQAQRRAAATREDLSGEDQVFDSANEGGMGDQGADTSRYRGHGRDTEGAFGEEVAPNDPPE